MSNLNVASSDRSPRPRTSGSGSNRLTPSSSGPVHAPETAQVHAPETTLDRDMIAEHAPSYPAAPGAGILGIETGIKLIISNLAYGVSIEEIKDLLSRAGHIKRCSLCHDKSWRSEVIFSSRSDAEAACKLYNGVSLCGKPLKIEFAGTNIAASALPRIRNRLHGNPNPAPRSASMPQPPQNWPQKERQVKSCNSARNYSHEIENFPDLNESEEQSKRPRGQAIGPEATILSSKLGVLARNGQLAPLTYKDWRIVPDMYKDKIWDHIQENTDATDDMKKYLMKSFGSKWKNWKHDAKRKGYDPYSTDIERLANCPNKVEEDQWRELVYYWSSKDAKGMKTCREVFKKTHSRKNKQLINGIAGEVMIIDDLAEVYPKLNVPGSAPCDVCSKVMGPGTHGIVRTLEKAASPSSVCGPVYKQSHTGQRDVDTKVELEVQKATLAMKIEMEEKVRIEMEEKFSEAKKEITAMFKAMEKQLSETNKNMEATVAYKSKGEMQTLKEVCDSSGEDKQQPDSLGSLRYLFVSSEFDQLPSLGSNSQVNSSNYRSYSVYQRLEKVSPKF